MNEKLQFRVGAGLKNIIGRDLITDDFIAIFELVKNSFDAHATEVEIVFENIKSSDGKILIVDNGKGMNYDDLLNKWLFVAYSAKKDGSEDSDYRKKLSSKTYYAGAKGIGRFSCDKLGSKLRLISTKDEKHSKTEVIEVDWSMFEQKLKDEFINISIKHETLQENPSKFKTGTQLEISSIRSDSEWNENKILNLRNSLAKLINPFQDNSKRPFKITIIAPDFVEHDSNVEDSRYKINGEITNPLLEILSIKTIKISSNISEDGAKIITELSNNGNWLYRIVENNTEFKLLKNILIELYFLDQRAKNNFTRLMGVRSGSYGSVFLYKNGIRIYPYGEPDDDSFNLNKRQQKRLGDYVGTRDLIGRVEILGDNEEFKETTSRGDGLVKNTSYLQLEYFLIEKVIEKLESYRRNINKYGIDIDEFENTKHSQEKIVKLIADISSSDNIVSIDFNPNLLEIISSTQEESSSAKSLIKSIEKIAADTQNQELVNKIKQVKTTLDDAIVIADLAEEELKEKEKEIKEKQTQNLFLKATRSQEFDDLISFMHHAGIYAQTINSYLKNISLKLNRNIEIKRDDLIEIIRTISFEANKILSITEFATKANFRLKTEDIDSDIINYIEEYFSKIVPSVNNKTMEINFTNLAMKPVVRKFKPIELNILIDNLVTNSRKANATELAVNLNESNGKIVLDFIDNGIGINPKNIKSIFEFGYTTTDGSGLGLYHVKQIIDSMNGKISVQNNNEKGVTFKIEI
jgi:signal transduction histidine kinase